MISERFKKIVCDELELNVEDVEMKDDTIASEVPGWDSLSHVNVITALEKDYNVRFKGIEILKCKNIGDLQKLVDSKLQ
ncbi:MAG: acyl carrier protein [Ignavibacteriae bacterium HGW-Ignavibacteriae-2]|jgi:acyl carrier protein|nr:acyl carrier protein [Bacteroidota bacterium]PKL87601.1 MAG: acyl carrier protein [Ignavibacteriae bacterium HGW-Ignavibacteriae-2]